MKKIRSAIINGKRWRINWTKPNTGDFALCHHNLHMIQIDPNVDEITLTSIVADEVCHVHFPQLDNEYVDTFSDDVAKVMRDIELIADE